MKKLLTLLSLLALGAMAFAQSKTVQVVMPECANVSESEAAWLPGQIQDKLKSNLQEYLGMRTVVDSKSEAALKKLQRDSESAGRDENTAIELGKISTAQFAVMTKIRKTGKGYTISTDYTDMTTGEQKATAASKEYKSIEELYGSTGAIDEITLILADKLGIAINPIQKQALQYGTADFSIDDQLRLARENEENYKKLMSQFDEQIRVLSASNDLNAVENVKKIEAEKSMLAEKQKTERKRLAELEEQKKKADADARLEAQRSAEQKKKRDALSAQAAKKASEVRKLKMEKQGVFGQISVIESKKKALVEIRSGVEEQLKEMHKQTEADIKAEESKILNMAWTAAELENGKPIDAAVKRRQNQAAESRKKLMDTFFTNAKTIRKSVEKQDASLLAEIRKDQKSITKRRTVSSIGGDLKVSYSTYSGKNGGWNAYISLYSEGILVYNNSFLIQYKSLTGKNAPDMEKASDSAVQKYKDTVDMYNSLLTRGDPILYFEIDYTVSALDDNNPSAYNFSFEELRTINMINGKTIQKDSLTTKLGRTMTPAWDIRESLSLMDIEMDSQTFIDSENATTLQRVLRRMVRIPNTSSYITKTAFREGTLEEAFSSCNNLNQISGNKDAYIAYEKSGLGTVANAVTGTVMFPTGLLVGVVETCTGAYLIEMAFDSFYPATRFFFRNALPFNVPTVTNMEQNKKAKGFRVPTEKERKNLGITSCWTIDDNVYGKWLDDDERASIAKYVRPYYIVYDAGK